MLAEILKPITTKQGTLKPGQLIELSKVAMQRLAGKVRPLEINQPPVAPLPQWQHNLCFAHALFNNWQGCCPLSVDDCLISKILDCEGDIEKLKGFTLGQGVNTDDVIQLWLESGEPVITLLQQPLWFICIAEYIKGVKKCQP